MVELITNFWTLALIIYIYIYIVHCILGIWKLCKLIFVSSTTTLMNFSSLLGGSLHLASSFVVVHGHFIALRCKFKVYMFTLNCPCLSYFVWHCVVSVLLCYIDFSMFVCF
jgi:hypothetical protein